MRNRVSAKHVFVVKIIMFQRTIEGLFIITFLCIIVLVDGNQIFYKIAERSSER
jgi:hypothetical protein